ncbi:MAG TPA: cupin domain-containing protein [Candidatus Acidoferrales bacterium]|nr:cupin domain-containing protein [Candidatus Acidoferrales bacterium]
MKSRIAKLMLLVAGALLGATAASTGEGVPAAVHYIPHDQVASVMAKGGQIVNDPGLIVLANRKGAAEVEYHEHTNHIFIMVDGEATFVTGGTMVGAKETAPGQMRATSIEGGETHHLSKGDVITIPAKTPHWWKEVSTKTVGYYAVNIESK